MNNQLLEAWQNKSEVELTTAERFSKDIALENVVSILEAIEFFKGNQQYLDFKRLVLDPSIQTVSKRIERNMKDLVNDTTGVIKNSILQDQGMLAAFKKFADLDALENIYKVELRNLKNHA